MEAKTKIKDYIKTNPVLETKDIKKKRGNQFICNEGETKTLVLIVVL